MTICFLADAQSIHTKKWVTYFADREYEVHLLSFQSAYIPRVIFHPIRKLFLVRHGPGAQGYRKVEYLLHLRQIKKLIRRIAPDILHAHWATSYGIIGAYSGYHPFFLSSWGSDIFNFPHISWLHRKTLEYIVNRADYITATSQMLARETQEYLKRDISVHTIPFGVDQARFSPRKSKASQDVTIGIVKKLEKKYGIEYLIRAFAQLSAGGLETKLLIVGNGSEEEHLRQLCQSLNIEKRVHFTGFVDHSRVPDYLNQIDIFVVPSVEPSETFGVAAVEAAACGIPVIASNVGGLPEVVVDGQTGFLVPPKKPEAIAEKLLLLIKNIKLREGMGAAARRFVEQNYVWEQNAALMEKLYWQAAGKQHGCVSRA